MLVALIVVIGIATWSLIVLFLLLLCRMAAFGDRVQAPRAAASLSSLGRSA